jgi:hypothetical protein
MPVHVRWLVRLLMVGLVTAGTALGLATPSSASDAPTSVSIEGTGLAGPIVIKSTQQHDLFATLLRQVSWMSGGNGDPMVPDPAALGTKYRLTVFVDQRPVQVCDVYPQAAGGPRAYRPAAQPQNKTSEAWFYASLSLPDLLRAAGVPLARPAASGQAGGVDYADPAGYVPAAVPTTAPAFSLGKTLGGQLRTLVIWIGTALVVLLMVWAAALRSRRYGR